MRLFLLLPAVLLPGPALAASDVPPPACETQQTTREMVECAAWELEVAERWLNQVHGIIHDEMDDQGRALLRDAQRAWIAWRDAGCGAEADEARGGTIAPLIEVSCRTEQTELRARALSRRLEGADPPPFIADYMGRQVGVFACDGRMVEARLGLRPVEPAGTVEVDLMVGTGFLSWPVDPRRQDALCGADVSLWLAINPENPACPALAVEDGLCDRFLVYWDGTQYVTQRN